MKKKRFTIKKRWLAVLGLLLVLGGFYAVKVKAPAQAAASDYGLATLERQTVREKVLISGLAVSEHEQVLQAGLTGKVESVYVEAGEPVEKNQALIKMEDAQALALVKAAELNLQSAREALETFEQDAGQTVRMNYQSAKLAYDSAVQVDAQQVQLLALGSVSTQEASQARQALVQAETAYLSAKIQYEAFDYDQERDKRVLAVEQAESEWEDAKEEWSNAELLSPIDGVVTRVDVKEGDQVQLGFDMIEVKDTGALKVMATINEFDAANLSEGNAVSIYRNADPEKAYHGTITYLSPAGVRLNGKTVFNVEVRVDDEDEFFKINNSVQMEIIVHEQADVLAVPFEAIGDLDGQKVLFVDRDGVETIVPVDLGVRGDYHVEVMGEGLVEGDQIRLYVEDAGAFIERW